MPPVNPTALSIAGAPKMDATSGSATKPCLSRTTTVETHVWQGLLFDISDLKEAERRIRFQAHHDALTGLPNRSRFLESLNLALHRAEAREESVAILFLDLDNFKDVNDSFGHEAGDRLLIAVAERLAAQSGPLEIAARLGGDEFTVLLDTVPAPTAEASAAAAAERFLEPLRAPFAIAGQEIFVRASIGVAVASPGVDGPEDLLRQADVALYTAKRQGKGSYRVYDPTIQTDALERLQLEAQLTHAIERQEFRVFYQPIVDLGSGQIAGLEALDPLAASHPWPARPVRLHHDRRRDGPDRLDRPVGSDRSLQSGQNIPASPRPGRRATRPCPSASTSRPGNSSSRGSCPASPPFSARPISRLNA